MTARARGRLAVHGHFYQPLRVDPFTGEVPPEPSAAPFRDWNTRIDAECYRPNAERGTYGHMSWDLGPTLAAWLARHATASHRGFVEGDGWRPAGPDVDERRGNGMATGYHHSILPLGSADDRRTEIRWGIRDFLLRFGRPPDGFWMPETAVDLGTLRVMAEEGIRYTIVAPWQVADAGIDNRRPYRVELGGGRSMVVAVYDGSLSAAVSFDPSATADADRFARERVATRLSGTPFPDGESGLIVIATDGELYGHHQQFRDLFLQRLVAPAASDPDRGFDVIELASALLEPGRRLPAIRIADRTSWSCHHGVARWSAECPCATDGRWKGPLRAALDRLAGGIDALTDQVFARLPGSPDRRRARDAYVDVVFGAEPPAAFAARWLGDAAAAADRRVFLDLLEAQRWRLAMFTSDGWFWDDPIRPETRQNLRCAARAARLVDGATGSAVERRLVGDLTLLASAAAGLDGSAIYRQALADIGQPGPA